jgi:hypothetical protein
MKIAIITSLFAKGNMNINAGQKVKFILFFDIKKVGFKKFNLDLKSQ